jgi:copper(I)-binding protein
MKFIPLLAGMALLATTLTGCATPKAEISISNAWVRASSYSDHVSGMTGVFAKITNNGDADATLIGGSTDIAPIVETHEVVNGMMQKKDGGITIPAHSTVELKPGGLHVMLMNLKKAIIPGDTIKVTISFKGASSQTLTLLAKTADAGDEKYFKTKK